MTIFFSYTIAIICLIQFKLLWDTYARIVQRRVINHGFSAGMDIIIYFLLAILINLHYNQEYNNVTGLVLLGYGLSLRWLLFDLVYSKLQKDEWQYYGRTSTIDKFCKRFGACIIVKIIVLIGFILTYFFVN